MSPSPSKSPLVILDAGVVIEAFRTNSWAALVDRYAIVVSRAVKGEVIYFKDAHGEKVPISLARYETDESISVIDVPAGRLKAFLGRFDPGYVERLDAGELESLCYLIEHAGTRAQICSADSIVYKVLGKLRMSGQGISLEELLTTAGCPKTLQEKYRKSFRERWSSEGFSDSFVS
jgi:hypothetical protein